jgi:hypothetical protein
MFKKEEKFIVINRKHITKNDARLISNICLERNVPENKYYVCNQDEPYAEKVLQTIKEGEEQKQRKKPSELNLSQKLDEKTVMGILVLDYDPETYADLTSKYECCRRGSEDWVYRGEWVYRNDIDKILKEL